jgi:hypothetical protein
LTSGLSTADRRSAPEDGGVGSATLGWIVADAGNDDLTQSLEVARFIPEATPRYPAARMVEASRG